MKMILLLKYALFSLSLLIACAASAATITWTGGGGDNRWNTEANWSGGSLPGSEDNVVVNVPGNPTIVLETQGATVRSIQCAESFRLDGVSLAIAGGSASFTGPVSFSAASLSVDGATAVANLSGPTTFEISACYAYNGAKAWLTNLTRLVLTNGHATAWAQGVDTAIYLSNVTNLVASPGHVFYVYAYDGGLVDLRWLRNPGGGLQVACNTGSTVDLSALSGALSAPVGTLHSFSASGGSIVMPQVTALRRVSVSVTGDGQVGWGAVTNAEECAFYAYSGAKLWLTNLTRLVLTNGPMTAWAQGVDAAIYMPNVTNLFATQGYTFYVYSYDGGLLDLQRLRNPNGGFQVACNTGSTVDLSGLSGALSAPEGTIHSFSANGGSILMPQVRALRRVSVSVTGDGQVGWGAVTNAEECAFYAYSGAKLWLTNLATLVLINGHMTAWAQGVDAAIYMPNVTNLFATQGYSFYVYSYDGGLVDLRRLRNPGGGLQVACNTGSTVDLSGLSGALSAPVGTLHSFSANGGSIVMPQVTALRRVSVSVTGDGQVGWGAVTNAEECAFYAYSGAKLWLTNLATLVLTNGHMSAWAQGVDAAIYMPNVTNLFATQGYSLYLYGFEGGLVDLQRLRNPNGGLQVSCGLGSTVDLSGVSGRLSPPDGVSHGFTVNDGSILMPHVTALTRVTVSVSGNGVVVWGAITNVQQSAFYAYSGAKLSLTNLTGLVLDDWHVTVLAQGADAVIDLSNLNTVVSTPGYMLQVVAVAGGRVNLRGLDSVTGGNLNVLSREVGSVVDLSGLSSLTPPTAGSSLQADSGGVILLNDAAVLISNVTLNFESSPNSIIPAFASSGADLVLYARPWNAYLIEMRDTRVPDSVWTNYLRVAMTNAIQTVSTRPPRHLAFRVRVLLADPPALRIDRTGAQQTQLTLFGIPGQTYRIESRSALGTAETWQNGTTVTFTNAFRIFPAAASPGVSRFHRARKL